MSAEPNGGSVGEEEGNEIPVHSASSVPAEDGDEDLEAVEPWVDDLPEGQEEPGEKTERSAHYDLLPQPGNNEE